jgi:hypothetical protein
VIIFAIVASILGLLQRGIYRDNDFVTSAWLANDAITLFTAIPFMMVALFFTIRGSLAWTIIWLGLLDYFLYNYSFYLFGAGFNPLFLLYVLIVGSSIYAMICGLASFDRRNLIRSVSSRMPVRWIAIYLLFVAAGLTSIYVAQSLGYVVNGTLPEIVTRTDHPTSVVFALDLTLLVPAMVLGAVWVWQRKAWGYILTGISLIKGTLYTLVLTSGALFGTYRGIEGLVGEIPLWATLTLLGLTMNAVFFARIRTPYAMYSYTTTHEPE